MKVKDLIKELDKLIPDQEILFATYPEDHPTEIAGLRAETIWYLPGAELPFGLGKNKSKGYDELQFTILIGKDRCDSINITWEDEGGEYIL